MRANKPPAPQNHQRTGGTQRNDDHGGLRGRNRGERVNNLSFQEAVVKRAQLEVKRMGARDLDEALQMLRKQQEGRA